MRAAVPAFVLFLAAACAGSEPAAPEAALDGDASAVSARDATTDAHHTVADARADVVQPIHLTTTGFFHTEQAGGRWWLVTPDGKPFFSLGVNHVTPDPDTDQMTGMCPYCQTVAKDYASTQAWAVATVKRLQGWGFNTVGAWSDNSLLGTELPYTVLLNLGDGVSDYFESFVRHELREHCGEHRRAAQGRPAAPGLVPRQRASLGPGLAQRRDAPSHLRAAARGVAGSPRRGRAHGGRRGVRPCGRGAVLHRHHLGGARRRPEPPCPRRAHHQRPLPGRRGGGRWQVGGCHERQQLHVQSGASGDAQYALRPGAVDRRHARGLLRGGETPAALQRILVPRRGQRSAEHLSARVPRPRDAGGPRRCVRTVHAELVRGPVRRRPALVQLVDEPPGGRFDGENSNFGLVSTSDVPWQALVERATEINAKAPSLLVPTH